jgi:putative nucleotidyltransferase with HDIG domain
MHEGEAVSSPLPSLPIAASNITPLTPLAPVVARQVTAERVLAEIDRLAVLPTVAMDIIRVVDDPATEVADVEKIVCRDPGVTARLFKLANTAFFARRGRVSTIGEAVKRLGFRTIKSLVIAASAGQLLARSMRRYTYSENGLWHHSLGLAIASRQLARRLEWSAVVQDELFLDGLLHDIGKLALDPLLSEIDAGSEFLTTEMERALIGLDHTMVGRRIAEKWQLPEHVAAVIANHHTVETSEEFRQHIAAVHVTDCLLNHTNLGLADHVEFAAVIEPTALTVLHLDIHDVEELEEEVNASLPDIVSVCRELE